MSGPQNKQNIKAVILAQGCDFGRYPLASQLPTPLWPIGGQPVLSRLLSHLRRQGIKQAVICSNSDGALIQEHLSAIDSMHLEFLDESLPVGTAGCIRDAANGDKDSLFMVFYASIVLPPDIRKLIRTHQNGNSDLTVLFEPNGDNNMPKDFTSEIYVFESEVLKYIPKEGYCDIKEGLIPAMLRKGRAVHASTVSEPIGNFRDRAGYLAAITRYLEKSENVNIDFPPAKYNGKKNIWIAKNAKIEPDVRIYGPAIIMSNTTISEKVIILGPSMIGNNVFVGKNTLIENCTLWDGSNIAENCEIHSSIIGYDTTVRHNTTIEEKAIILEQRFALQRKINRPESFASCQTNKLRSEVQPLITRLNEKLPARLWHTGILQGLGVVALFTVFTWCYHPELTDLWNIWLSSDEYSSGLLVPFLAVYILWTRRHKFTKKMIKPSIWGLAALIIVQAIRYFGLFFMYSSVERLSLVLSIASLTLLLFGWQILRITSPVLLFLCLMLPLPRSAHTAVMLPMQNLATTSAVFCLETMGFAVARDGNIIHLNDTSVAITEACNGLRMVTAFFTIAILMALLTQRPWWQKLTILISSLPIALLCNTLRLTITAIAFTILEGEKWEGIFHDFGGYAMMPLALFVVIFELWILTRLTIAPQEIPKKQVIIYKPKN